MIFYRLKVMLVIQYTGLAAFPTAWILTICYEATLALSQVLHYTASFCIFFFVKRGFFKNVFGVLMKNKWTFIYHHYQAIIGRIWWSIHRLAFCGLWRKEALPYTQRTMMSLCGEILNLLSSWISCLQKVYEGINSVLDTLLDTLDPPLLCQVNVITWL